jgi:hypothetical protein
MNIMNDIRGVTASTFQFWRGETSFPTLSLRGVLLSVVLLSMIRAFMDVIFWLSSSPFPLWMWFFLNFIMWIFYILSLYLSTGFLLSAVTPGLSFKQALTMAVHVYWVIPLVPLFSILPIERTLGLGTFITIPFFRYIPTFVVEKNYLPLGMLVVIPFVLLMTTRFLVQIARVSTTRAVITSLLVYLLVYAYYYQWAWVPDLMAVFEKGFVGLDAHKALIVVNSFSCHLVTFLLMPKVASSYREIPRWAYLTISGVILVGLFFMPRLGVFWVFLAPGHP